MNCELILLSALGLHPCKPCPRIARVGAIAGAAHEGDLSNIRRAAIETLTAYRQEAPSCGLPGKDVVCFLRRERTNPLVSPVLAPAE